MSAYLQVNRPLAVSTPLGADALLLVGFTGREAISQPFVFHLDLLAPNGQAVAFDKLLGHRATVRLQMPGGQRFFSGICNRISQGARDRTFTTYRMEVVPQLWLLTRRARSRIFQQKSVPDILKEVLNGFDVEFCLQGTWHPRDYCVQYRETDFNFASRLMEEEGIFYFFKHAADGHKMVVANTAQAHPDLPGKSALIYEEVVGGNRPEDRIHGWEKFQELRAGKVTVWDHHFELAHKHLEASKAIQDSVACGTVTHKLRLEACNGLELYDWPGGYAHHFDGVDPGGGDRTADLQKVFTDNQRTTDLRMQEEALTGLLVEGVSDCRQLTSGHKFTLTRHFNADGPYVLTSVGHSATLPGNYRSGDGAAGLLYQNRFTAIPLALPFRPVRRTPPPVVPGTQTAVVVGPPGEEVFPDKYGRVKVQFHWDREGKYDPNSSCWLRVSQFWAGKRWGALFLPRVGHEVLVDFLDGDPDQPIITGSLYNSENLPHYELPANKTRSYVKSNSTPGGQGFNELRLEDKKGEEQVFLHAERNLDVRVKQDHLEWVGRDRHLIVQRDRFERIEGDDHLGVRHDRNVGVGGTISWTAGGDGQMKVGNNFALDAGTEIHLKSGCHLVIESSCITLKACGSFITISPGGVDIMGPLVRINSGGCAGPGAGASPASPKPPKEADRAEAGDKGEPPPTTATGGAFADRAGASGSPVSPSAKVLQNAAREGTPTCEICEKLEQVQGLRG
jgi:type VI secretion system secreted protein VgrG